MEAVRKAFLEVPVEHAETRRVGRVTYLVDTRPSGRVYEYLPPTMPVFGDKAFLVFNQNLLAAFMVVGDDIVWLQDNAAKITDVQALDQHEHDLNWRAARRKAKAELSVEQHDQAQAEFRAKQETRTVTLGDLERRPLPRRTDPRQ